MRIVAVVLVGLLAFGAAGLGREEPSPVPLIHGFASLAIPGLGQYLNEEYDKALVHFGVSVALVIGGSYLAAILPHPGFSLYWGVGLAHTLWALYSGWDAYQVALRREGLTLSPLGFSLRF
ncbi:TPA: hypothetical protein DCY67_05650 [Candidatus Acetothermia bacterium]|nr:hypothetical protein [Candidatus Acetothermia bacterium]